MAKLIKKTVAAVKKAVAPAKEKRISAASIVLGMLNLKVVPTDEQIISAVLEACEGSKFKKTHLAWYKYQFKQGRWNDGEPQVIRQAAVVKEAKKVMSKKGKAVSKKAKVVKVEEEIEE